ITEREVVHDPRPEIVGKPEATAVAGIEPEDLDECLRRHDVLPDRQEIAHAEPESLDHARRVDRDRLGRRRAWRADLREGLAADDLAPETGVALPQRACGAEPLRHQRQALARAVAGRN